MANDKDFIVKNAVEVGGPTNVTLGTITGNAINLSTGNYFKDTLAANTTYTISNAGDVQSFQLEVTGGAVGYDFGGAVYDSVSFSLAGQEGAPSSLFFKPDGTKMYVVGASGEDILEYNLSTAWDVGTASYFRNFVTSSQENSPTGVFFKPDGTKMYVVGTSGDDVNEYDLNTAWNISSASYTQNFSVSAQDTLPKDIFFKHDGTKMYIVGDAGNDINEYTLSTAWDISIASYTQNFSVSAQDSAPSSLFFKPDGTKMYVGGTTNDDLYEYALTTAWDISTASYVQTLTLPPTQDDPTGVFFKDDGIKMYVVSAGGDAVFQYSTAATATLTWPSSIEFAGGIAPAAPATGETDVFTFSTDDGGTSYIGTKTADNLS